MIQRPPINTSDSVFKIKTSKRDIYLIDSFKSMTLHDLLDDNGIFLVRSTHTHSQYDIFNWRFFDHLEEVHNFLSKNYPDIISKDSMTSSVSVPNDLMLFFSLKGNKVYLGEISIVDF